MTTYVSASLDCLGPEDVGSWNRAPCPTRLGSSYIWLCNAYWTSFFIPKSIGADDNIVFVVDIFISKCFFITCVPYYKRKEEFLWFNLCHSSKHQINRLSQRDHNKGTEFQMKQGSEDRL
jgi:hypothetical protein